MGEPTPGQIPDNIFLSIQQLKMKSNEIGKAGQNLVQDTGGYWRLADTTTDIIIPQYAQARVDFDTSGLTDGQISIEAMVSPSYIYAIAGGAIKNGANVKLNNAVVSDPAYAIGQTFVQAIVGDIAAGSVKGQFSRLAGDSAGNNDSVAGSVIIIKLGAAI